MKRKQAQNMTTTDPRLSRMIAAGVPQQRDDQRISSREERYAQIEAHVPGLLFQMRRGSTGLLQFGFLSQACHDLLGQPPESLYANPARFLALSPNADDIWLNWMARLHGTPICRVGDDHEPVAWFGSRRVSLFRLNARGTNNDDCVERMVQAYGSDCLRERR